MKTLPFVTLSLLAVFGLLMTACGGPAPTEAPAQPTAGAAATEAAPTQPPAPTPTAGPALGEETRAAQAGFAFRAIPGYLLINEGDLVSLEAPDAQGGAGPGIVMLGGPNTNGMDVNNAFEPFTAQFSNVAEISQSAFSLGGFAGRLHEFTAQVQGSDVRGRFIALASPDNAQVFVLLALTPPEKWDSVEPYVTALTDSVTFFEPEGPAMVELRQWSVYGFASSEYSDQWPASNAEGEPDSAECGVTANGAWAPASSGAVETLELQYARPVEAAELNIFIVDNPAQLVKVEVAEEYGPYVEVWSGPLEETADCPQVLSIPLSNAGRVASVLLTVDLSIEGSGFEIGIDAVELAGGLPVPDPLPAGMIEQWAAGATASSSFFFEGEQALLGPQEVFRCGYGGETWTSAADNTVEWFEVTFDTPVVPSEVYVYEASNYGSGQIVKVELLDVSGTYHEVYSGAPQAVAECPYRFNVFIGEDFTEKVSAVRVTIDQSVLGNGYAYIDAVALIGTP